MLKQKFIAIILILIGAMTVPIEWDITFFVFTLTIGIGLFFAKDNYYIYEDDDEEDYEENYIYKS